MDRISAIAERVAGCGCGSGQGSYDRVPEAPNKPQDWTNPSVPPVSTENLAGRFVDGVPGALEGSTGRLAEEVFAMAREVSAGGVERKGRGVEYRLAFADRKVPGGEYISSVDSVGYDGRSWWWTAPNGMKAAYSDEARFRYALGQELRGTLKAGRIMGLLREEWGMGMPAAASEKEERS